MWCGPWRKRAEPAFPEPVLREPELGAASAGPAAVVVAPSRPSLPVKGPSVTPVAAVGEVRRWCRPGAGPDLCRRPGGRWARGTAPYPEAGAGRLDPAGQPQAAPQSLFLPLLYRLGIGGDHRFAQRGGLGLAARKFRTPGLPEQARHRLHPLFHQPVEARQGPIQQLAPQAGRAQPDPAAAGLGQHRCQTGQQGALQGGGAAVQAQHVGHVHEAGGAAADPVGVRLTEALHPRAR